jgi:hypothetical protein
LSLAEAQCVAAFKTWNGLAFTVRNKRSAGAMRRAAVNGTAMVLR